MATTTLTAADFTGGRYTGEHDLRNLEGHLKIEGDLGRVAVDSIRTKGALLVPSPDTWLDVGGCMDVRGWLDVRGGVVCGLAVNVKAKINVRHRIFAGVCNWREISDADKTITCGKLESGEVAFGTLVETGIEEEPSVEPSAELMAELIELRDRFDDLKKRAGA